MQIARKANTIQKYLAIFPKPKKVQLFPSTKYFFSEQPAEDQPYSSATEQQVEIDTTITSTRKDPFASNRANWTYYQGQIQASLLASNKAYLKTKFESSLLNENIVEIPALRYRTKHDRIMTLKNNREVACVLNDDHYVETDSETGEILKRGRM